MAAVIQIRRDTAANWTSANPTLYDGQQGYETDTGLIKIGDGTTAWTSLDYLGGLVASVNGQTDTVVLDADDIDDTSTTNKFVTASDLTNLGNLSGTNTGDQDLSSYLTSSTAASTYQPLDSVLTATTASFTTSLETKLNGIAAGAEVNTVDSVNGQTDTVVLDADDIDDTSTSHKFVTSSDLTVLGNTSGTNTGDQDLSGYLTTSGAAAAYQPLASVLTGTTASFTSALETKLSGIEAGAEVNTVDSVNSQTGTVVLDADDIDDTSTTNKFVTSGDLTNLGNLSGTNSGDQDLSGYLTSSTAASTYQPLATVLTNTTASFTTALDSKLSGIETGAEVNTVDSVNSQTGAVSLDADDIDDTSTTNKFVTSSDLTTLSNTSGTNTGDQLVFKTIAVSGESDVVADTTTDTLTFVAGTGMTITTNAGTDTVTFTSTGGAPVDSVNGATGVVVLDADDIDDTSTTNKFVTSGDLTNLGNLSGTNTGDQDLASYLTSATAASTYQPLATVLTNTTASFTSALETKLNGIETGAEVNTVDTVNGATGTVVLDADDIDDTSTTNKFVTASDITNLGNLSGTNTGDQDLSSYLTSATAASTYQPLATVLTNTTASFTTSLETKLNGIEASAEVNTVDSVNSQTGVVVLDADDIDDTSTTNKFVTAGDLTNLGNLSGTNTGDQDLSSYLTSATASSTYQPLATVLTNTTASFTSALETKLNGIEASAEVNTVDTVNSQTGAVVLDADDIDDTSTTNKFVVAADITNLGNLATGAFLKIHVGTTAPGSPATNDLWVDTN